MAGRPPKPAKQKELRGNPGKRPIPIEPEPSGRKAPKKAPKWCENMAEKEYVILRNELEAMDGAHLVDASLIAATADALETYVSVSREIRARNKERPNSGWVQEVPMLNKKGELVGYKRMAEPLVAVLKDAWSRFLKGRIELGATPSGRARLGMIVEHKKGSGVLDQLISMGKNKIHESK